MPTQDNYNATQGVGLEGALVNGEEFNAFSRTVETAAGIQFGRPVAKGAADKGIILMAAGQAFVGVTRHNKAVAPSIGTNGDRYAQYKEASVIDFGVFWGKASDAVVANAAANWDTATGKWTDAAVAGTVIACPGCKFDASGNADDLVPIRIRRPQA
jgi:hypothetical protein